MGILASRGVVPAVLLLRSRWDTQAGQKLKQMRGRKLKWRRSERGDLQFDNCETGSRSRTLRS